MVQCACADDPPVVARGRFVELATDRDAPVCAGTATRIDDIIEAGFAAIGETPPERAFIRYEWADGGAFAGIRGERILVRSPLLVHEHELAHAVHLHAWPRSARFMEEGFAMLLDPHRFRHTGLYGSSFTSEGLDAVLGDPVLEDGRYPAAWYIVSQLIRDHGMEGLRDLWHAVPKGASAETVRGAYVDLFERPIDALIEPVEIDVADETHLWDRRSCTYTLCVREPHPWDGDRWVAEGPTGCEDDPEAIGVMDPYTVDFPAGAVWREYVLDLDWFIESLELSDSVMAVVYPCDLYCGNNPWWFPAPFYPDNEELRLDPDLRYRIELRSEPSTSNEISPPDALPIERPGKMELTRAEVPE